MTTFDKREQGFESKFVYDEELRFKAQARRNRAVGEWAGSKLGLTGEALDSYVKDVRKADLVEKGDEDVFRKVKADFAAKGLAINDAEIRSFMMDSFTKAVSDLASAKS